MTCATCKDRDTCKTLCKDIKKQLQKEKIYSPDYIRPIGTKRDKNKKQHKYNIEVNSPDIDKLATLRAFELKYGKCKKRHEVE